MRFDEVYLDVDDVLADFLPAVLRLHGRSDLIGTLETHDVAVLGKTDSEIWTPIVDQKHYFWDELEVLPWAVELFHFCRQIGPVTFLTRNICKPEFGGADSGYAVRGKLTWLRRVYGQEIDDSDVIFTGRKESVARPGALLIDDSEGYEPKFRERGGRQIVFPKSWNRFRLRRDDPMDCVIEQYEGLLEE